MIGKLKCLLFGHKRGKLVGTTTNPNGPNFVHFQCPRCGHQTVYKRKVGE